MQNSDVMTRLTSLYGSQTSSVVLSTHNIVLCTRINRLYWFQPSPVVLCKQNNDFRTRITSLCGSKTPPVVLCRQYSVISTRNTCLYGSQPLSVVFECITATFGPEYKFSMGTRPHLSFLHAKQRDLHKNKNTIWVPALTCGFVYAKQRL